MRFSFPLTPFFRKKIFDVLDAKKGSYLALLVNCEVCVKLVISSVPIHTFCHVTVCQRTGVGPVSHARILNAWLVGILPANSLL